MRRSASSLDPLLLALDLVDFGPHPLFGLGRVVAAAAAAAGVGARGAAGGPAAAAAGRGRGRRRRRPAAAAAAELAGPADLAAALEQLALVGGTGGGSWRSALADSLRAFFATSARGRRAGRLGGVRRVCASALLCGLWPLPGAVCGARPGPRAAGRGRVCAGPSGSTGSRRAAGGAGRPAAACRTPGGRLQPPAGGGRAAARRGSGSSARARRLGGAPGGCGAPGAAAAASAPAAPAAAPARLLRPAEALALLPSAAWRPSAPSAWAFGGLGLRRLAAFALFPCCAAG